jgi:hypothetical protein
VAGERRLPAETEFRPGYPFDLRRADHRARAERGPVGDLELTAGRIVARLTGQRVYLQDDGSSDGMVDVRIEYANREPAYLEVTTDIEHGYAAMWSGLMKSGQIPQVVTMPSLHRQWSVTLSGAIQRRSLDAELEELLANMEACGLTYQQVAAVENLTATANASVRRLLDLGVVKLSSAPAQSGPVGALLYPDGITAPAVASWKPFLDWISETLESPKLADVRNKLMRTRAAERHVFLGITFSSPSAVYFALTVDEKGLPGMAPILPPEITHLWLWNIAGGDRCVVWFPDRGWLDVARHWVTE